MRSIQKRCSTSATMNATNWFSSKAQVNWITIRVGYRYNSAAKFYLRNQREVHDLLSMLNLQLGLPLLN